MTTRPISTHANQRLSVVPEPRGLDQGTNGASTSGPSVLAQHLNAYLGAPYTRRLRDDDSAYLGRTPGLARVNSFASARPSGRYYRNPYYLFPPTALPYQESSPFTTGVANRPLQASHPAAGSLQAPQLQRQSIQLPLGGGNDLSRGVTVVRPKHHDKVPNDFTFDNIETHTPYASVYPAEDHYAPPLSPSAVANAGYAHSNQPLAQPPLFTAPHHPNPAPIISHPPPHAYNRPFLPEAAPAASAYPEPPQRGDTSQTGDRPQDDNRGHSVANLPESLQQDHQKPQFDPIMADGPGETTPLANDIPPYEHQPLPPPFLFETDYGFGPIPDLEEDEDEPDTGILGEPAANRQGISLWDRIRTSLLLIVILPCLPFILLVRTVKRVGRSSHYEQVEHEATLGIVDKAVLFVTRYPKALYNFVLLTLPALYFSRVVKIFEEADLSLGAMKTWVLESADNSGLRYGFDSSGHPPAWKSMKKTWEEFISNLLREWKTFNLISVLLLSAILTILQIDAASADSYTRYFALSSLVCALVSLLYGCIFIVRFGTMRKPHKAAEWALESKKSRAGAFWNVWVLLAMPAVYLAWSLLLFICCIMAFVWRTGYADSLEAGNFETRATIHSMPLPVQIILRSMVSGILLLGFVYGVLIVRTFNRWGQKMDKAWQRRIDGWRALKASDEFYYAKEPIPQGHPSHHRAETPEDPFVAKHDASTETQGAGAQPGKDRDLGSGTGSSSTIHISVKSSARSQTPSDGARGEPGIPMGTFAFTGKSSDADDETIAQGAEDSGDDSDVDGDEDSSDAESALTETASWLPSSSFSSSQSIKVPDITVTRRGRHYAEMVSASTSSGGASLGSGSGHSTETCAETLNATPAKSKKPRAPAHITQAEIFDRPNFSEGASSSLMSTPGWKYPPPLHVSPPIPSNQIDILPPAPVISMRSNIPPLPPPPPPPLHLNPKQMGISLIGVSSPSTSPNPTAQPNEDPSTTSTFVSNQFIPMQPISDLSNAPRRPVHVPGDNPFQQASTGSRGDRSPKGTQSDTATSAKLHVGSPGRSAGSSSTSMGASTDLQHGFTQHSNLSSSTTPKEAEQGLGGLLLLPSAIPSAHSPSRSWLGGGHARRPSEKSKDDETKLTSAAMGLSPRSPSGGKSTARDQDDLDSQLDQILAERKDRFGSARGRP